jgi:hypothetical protein
VGIEVFQREGHVNEVCADYIMSCDGFE